MREVEEEEEEEEEKMVKEKEGFTSESVDTRCSCVEYATSPRAPGAPASS